MSASETSLAQLREGFFCICGPRRGGPPRREVSMNNRQSSYLAALCERVLVYDGAMGTSIDTFSLTAEGYGGERTFGARDYLVITRPDVIEAIHTSFMEAGADVL